MSRAVPITNFSSGEFAFEWEQLDRLIKEVEAAEFTLAYEGTFAAREQRKSTGSFYTPIDVAEHFWDLFFRVHGLTDAGAVRSFISRWDFVEPSAGSGILVFTLLRRLLQMGVTPTELSQIRFHVIDINLAALRFFSESLHELEKILGVKFPNVGLDQIDFLNWAKDTRHNRVAFVGNPPYVSNPRGDRWRNLFANFVEAMLQYRSLEKALCLILPLSVCFSRDYAELRTLIQQSGLGISTSNYDNIPDCLFKSGKPESTNTNRANSQRCTILNMGGPNAVRREATALLRWNVRQRSSVLSATPLFHDWSQWAFDGQLPRPENEGVMRYLAQAAGSPNIRSLTSATSAPTFGVGSVARNYIGIRDVGDSNSIIIRPANAESMLVLLQVLSSQLFFDYWRTVGDGFHVTAEAIDRFPISRKLYDFCLKNRHQARAAWSERNYFAKEKLNSGKLVRSFDFSRTFATWPNSEVLGNV